MNCFNIPCQERIIKCSPLNKTDSNRFRSFVSDTVYCDFLQLLKKIQVHLHKPLLDFVQGFLEIWYFLAGFDTSAAKCARASQTAGREAQGNPPKNSPGAEQPKEVKKIKTISKPVCNDCFLFFLQEFFYKDGTPGGIRHERSEVCASIADRRSRRAGQPTKKFLGCEATERCKKEKSGVQVYLHKPLLDFLQEFFYKDGTPGGIRTHDLLLRRQTLLRSKTLKKGVLP